MLENGKTAVFPGSSSLPDPHLTEKPPFSWKFGIHPDPHFRKEPLFYPSDKVVRFDDAGHFVPEEKPEELIREMRDLLAGQAHTPGIG